METTDHHSDAVPFHGNRNDRQFLSFIATKVVIQEIATRHYLSVDNFWTLDIEGATSFTTRSAALEQATNLKLQDVQLVLNREVKEWEVFPIKSCASA
ncbi:MAG: hypothetical protein IT579_23255 [Verrucomicrobia subdivision 3 bacterium]|nr:hypothetical protein [Verrucomicrobiota bacterium]MCC6823651.1 hypothetical protein [Limisphaerales bacterium]